MLNYSNSSYLVPQHMLASERAIWAATFGVVAGAITLSNALTMSVFLRTRFRHRQSTYLLINLTIADGMVGIVSIPLFIYMLMNDGHYGEIMYNVYAFQDIVLGITSICTLAFIALERFYAVRFPFRYRGTHPRVYFSVIAISWCFGIAIAGFRIMTSLGFIHLKTFTYILVTSIAFPLLVTCILYFAVWLSMSRTKRRYNRTADKEERLSNTLVIITGVFILSWAPFPIANIVNTFSKKLASLSSFITFTYTAKLLQYGNSLSNPIIYTLRIREFRMNLGKIFYREGEWNSTGSRSRALQPSRRRKSSSMSSRKSSSTKRK